MWLDFGYERNHIKVLFFIFIFDILIYLYILIFDIYRHALCDSTGCGRSWGDPVVSQLFADSGAPHGGCGQVQEPGVDQRQEHCRYICLFAVVRVCVLCAVSVRMGAT